MSAAIRCSYSAAAIAGRSPEGTGSSGRATSCRPARRVSLRALIHVSVARDPWHRAPRLDIQEPVFEPRLLYAIVPERHFPETRRRRPRGRPTGGLESVITASFHDPRVERLPVV